MSSSRLPRLAAQLSQRDVWLVAIISLVGAVLRLHMLGARCLWIDEATSVTLATMHWLPFVKRLWAYQGNMALYYFLLRFWIRLGDSEFAIRSLSAGLGVITIPALYIFARRLFGPGAALASAALLTLHSFHIRYSQEARAYTLLPLLLVVAAYLLLRAVEAPRQKHLWTSYAVIAAVAVYAHIFAVLVLAGHAVVLVLRKPFNVSWRKLVGTVLLFGLMIAPMVAFVVLQHNSQINWVPRPTWADVVQDSEMLTGNGGPWLLAIYIILCVLAFVRSREAQSSNESWGLLLILAWAVMPPILITAASFVKPMLVSRFLVMCIPALALLAGRGLPNLSVILGRVRWTGPVAASLVLGLSFWATQRSFSKLSAENDDWRSAVSYILDHEGVDDGTIFYIPNAESYRYYAHRAQELGVKREAPEVLYPPPDWKPLSRAEVEQVSAGRSCIWLVLHMDSTNPKMVQLIESTLNKSFRRVERQVFPGEDAIVVVRYVNDVRPAARTIDTHAELR